MKNESRKKELIKFLVISFISVIVFILSITYGEIRYETNDDAIINMIAAGAYGEPSQYLVHSGILFGYFVKCMYVILPDVNCYLVIFLICNLLSMLAVCCFVTEKMKICEAGVVSLLLNLLFAKDFFIDLQYTKNAAIYSTVGFAVVVKYLFVEKEKRNVFRLFFGSFLIALGLSVRQESFIQVLPLAVIFIILMAVLGVRDVGEIKKAIIMTFVPLIACMVVIGTNYVAFSVNEEWADFYQWDDIMVQKRDYGNYSFDWFKDDYLANGFTEWDFRLMEEWMWNDCDNFTLDKLELMAEIGKSIKMNRIRFDTELLKQTGQIICETASKRIYVYVLVALSLFIVVLSAINKKWINILVILTMLEGLFMEFYYLACIRRSVWRVEFGILFEGIIFLLLYIMNCNGSHRSNESMNNDTKRYSIQRFVSRFAVVLMSLVLFFYWQKDNLDYNKKSWEKIETYQFERMKNIGASDGIFVLSINELYGGLCGASNIWAISRNDYDGFYENIIPVGGWIIPSPIGMYHAHQNGISNVFKAFIDRDDVYYVGGGETMGYLLRYLDEKYCTGVGVTDVQYEWGTAWKFNKG